MRLPGRRGALALAASLGMGLLASCARQGAPPGGPRDQRPPVVVSVTPDTFATVDAGRGEIRIRFDERISERAESGPLDQAVRVSPRTGDVRVEHKRDGLSVVLDGGFRPGLVYRVRLEPVVQDMFGNTMRAPFEWVFSTGGEFQANAVGGLVWDRITGEPVEDVQVVLRAGTPDDEGFDTLPQHVAFADTTGIFALRYLPAGSYHVTAFQDRNLNGRTDPFEVQGSLAGLQVGAADTVVTDLSAMVPDTTPPQLVRAEVLDSLTLRIQVDDALDPDMDLSQAVAGVFPEDGSPPAMARVLHPWQWTAYQDTLRAVEDSLAAEAAAREPEPVVVDTAVADTAQVLDTARAQVAPGARPPLGGGGLGAAGRPAERIFLPNGQRIPAREFFVRLLEPLRPGEPYTVRIRALVNISGLVSEEQETAASYNPPAPPPADTGAVADTGTVADTLRAPPDTGRLVLPPRRR